MKIKPNRVLWFKGIAGKPQGGFSLLEILAVVTVVAVLALLLIPGVQSMRMKASQARSAANLKAIGVAMYSFSVDHDGYPPPPRGYLNGSDALFWWPVFLLPYVGEDPQVFDRPEMTKVWKDSAAENPSTGEQFRIGYWINGGNDSRVPFPHGASYASATDAGVNFYRFIRFKKPSNTIALVEAAGPDSSSKSQPNWNPGYNGKWLSGENDKFHHWPDGSFNVLWLDGHVSKEKPDTLTMEQFTISN